MLNVHKWRKKNSILKIEKSIQFDLHNVRLTKNGQKVIEITKEKMHFYFIAGHVFTLSENIDFKPAVLSKIVEGAPLQADVTANFLFFDKLTLGAAYRWDASVSALAGFQISDSWFIGYGYDLETSKLANYNSGSHEIFLRYEFFNRSRVSAPRFF